MPARMQGCRTRGAGICVCEGIQITIVSNIIIWQRIVDAKILLALSHRDWVIDVLRPLERPGAGTKLSVCHFHLRAVAWLGCIAIGAAVNPEFWRSTPVPYAACCYPQGTIPSTG